jgi:hypothetical protein
VVCGRTTPSSATRSAARAKRRRRPLKGSSTGGSNLHMTGTLGKVGRTFDELGLVPPERCFFGSSWYFRHYGHAIAEDVHLHGANVVHIQNFSQFAPRIKERNPRAKVLLNMHADWLVELDRRWVQPRLAFVDAIICCSDYFANGIREAWPEFANGFTFSTTA